MKDIIVDQCIICGNKKTKPVLRLKDYLLSKESFTINECPKCGFRFLNNPPNKDNAHSYYETEDYVEHSDNSKGIINKIYHLSRKWMFHYKLNLLNRFKQRKQILDFGTGTGYFLRFMKQKGYDCSGVEISERARNFGKKKFELNIISPEKIYDSNFTTGYGYITFWHVLEHIYDIQKVLDRMHALLDKNGILVVALPNYTCLESRIYGQFWGGYDAPRHLWHFTKSTFTRFAEKHNFELIQTKILPLDPFYNCLISESYRGKKWAYFIIPFIGLLSLIHGWLNHDKASSIIYFLKKKDD